MKSKERNLILGFLQKKVKQFYFSKATFFYFPFFSVSPNFANIWVDFANNLNFFDLLVYLGNMWIIAKKKSIYYIVCTTELRKSYVYRGGGVAGHWAGTVLHGVAELWGREATKKRYFTVVSFAHMIENINNKKLYKI